jgi:hypothetical protein
MSEIFTWITVKNGKVDRIRQSRTGESPGPEWLKVPSDWNGNPNDDLTWFDESGHRIPDTQLVAKGKRQDNRGWWYHKQKAGKSIFVYNLDDEAPGEDWIRKPLLGNKSNQKKGAIMLMRDLITDFKLLKIADYIEHLLGYQIEAEIMPDDHRFLASASMQLQNEKFNFWYIEEEPPIQPMVCHELMHIILFLEGFPTFILTDPYWYPSEYRTQTICMISNLVLHIKVWELTSRLGFNEHEHYILDDLLAEVKAATLFQKARNPQIILPAQGAFLAQGLLCPAADETKKKIREAAKQTMPRALELADAICGVFSEYTPLVPKTCADALYKILDLITCPREILRPVFHCNDYKDLHSPLFDL